MSIPQQFDIMVTTSCNAGCSFCVQEATFKPGNISDEWFIANMRDYFREFYDLGGRRVVITGGEPTLVLPRVLKVLDVLRTYRDLHVNAMYTNGSRLLSRVDSSEYVSVAQNLKAASLGCVNLSVHDYNNDRNNRILGLPHKSSTEDIAAHLRECDLPFRLNLTLQKDGVESYGQFLRYVEWATRLGAKDIYVRELFRFGFDIPMCRSERNPIETTAFSLVKIDGLLERMQNDNKTFQLCGQHHETARDKDEFEFVHLPSEKQVTLSRLTIGTEDMSQWPYLVYMPDGKLYRGWLGPLHQVQEMDGDGCVQNNRCS